MYQEQRGWGKHPTPITPIRSTNVAEQQKMSSFAKKLGARVAAANAEHRDKPVDLGSRRLPGGIRNGIAKLSAMYTKEQTEENGMVPKGETFFRASAIVVMPKEFNGEKVEGMITQVMIPLCDVPAKGKRKEKLFSDNWYEFQNLFKTLGIVPPPETPQTDPTGERTQNYYFSAMKALTDPRRPVYISFSTRSWTPPADPSDPNNKPQEMVFETWHGQCDPPDEEQFDPAAGVRELSQPPLPPTKEPFNEFTPSPPNGATEQDARDDAQTKEDWEQEVAELVDITTKDPEGDTNDGVEAQNRLEQLALSNGWTEQQVRDAASWREVGDMALYTPDKGEHMANGVAVGSRWKFAKRTKDGARMTDSQGQPFPPIEVEVVTVDPESATCTLKSVKDGKPVMTLRGKNPIAVRFEWLEPV